MRVRERHLSYRGLLYLAIGLIALAMVAISMTILGLRADAIRNAERETSNLAIVLAQQADHSVQTIDLVLTELQERAAAMGIATPEEFRARYRDQATFDLLTDRKTRVSQANFIAIIGADGELINSSLSGPAATLDLRDRIYYRHWQANNSGGLFVCGPALNKVQNIWAVQFSRRVNNSRGEFLGVVLLSVGVDYFEQIYSSLSAMKDQSFTLSGRDGSVLAHFPRLEGGTTSISGDSEWFGRVAEGGGSYRSETDFDGVPRLITVQPLRDYPLVVSTGLSEEAALADWRRRAGLICLGTALVLLCATLLLRAGTTQFRKLIQSEAIVAEREARLAEQSKELALANMQSDAALHNMSQGLCMMDGTGRIIVVNDRFRQMYGLSKDVVKPGCALIDLLKHRKAVGLMLEDPQEYHAAILRDFSTGRPTTRLIQTADGRTIQAVIEPTPDGGWVATHSDITERRRSEERMQFMARHDGLTGLANRVQFLDRVNERLSALEVGGKPFAILMLDLDQFKQVNDSLGHPVGDALIQAVAFRLKAVTRDCDTVARLGGDEFAICYPLDHDDREQAMSLATRLLADVSKPYELEGHQVIVETSIGIALAPKDGVSADRLVKNADLALYGAKADGRNTFRFFKPEMESRARDRHALQNDLRQALARQEFEIHYQTLVDVQTRRASGVEALLRWRSPRRGMVSPDQFIPTAEEMGLIVPLGEWVLRQACADAMRLPDHVSMAVNLSAVQFRNAGLIDSVAAALAESGLAPERLQLEVTESVLLSNNAQNIAMLHQLKSLGLSIVLDDFGTGYSSLSYLTLFPFDKIKVDRSFVSELTNRAECAAIVCAVIGLGRGLNILTTAEGVETDEQFILLQAAGCSEAQGYLFSRPCPANHIDLDAAEAAVQRSIRDHRSEASRQTA
jgi:diguanylate cyclase (GGDEF)-like protein/PAS domain S-box-containing protein